MTADLAGALRAPELAEARILARAAGENFAVAPRILPRRYREPLRALYGFARLVDEIGDAADGDRLALLVRSRRTCCAPSAARRAMRCSSASRP